MEYVYSRSVYWYRSCTGIWYNSTTYEYGSSTGYFLFPARRVVEERSAMHHMYENQRYQPNSPKNACGFGEGFWLSLA